MTDRRAYPSDLSDARWALIEPRLTAWRQARTDAGVQGRPPTHDLREIFNAILYVNRTGIAWRYLPHGFPPHATVYGYFASWSKEGIFTELNYNLTGLVRNHHGRAVEPTAAIMDTQSVETSTNVPLETQGIDAGKKIVGRKRSIITDTLGLLLAIIVTAASVSDNVIGNDLLDQAAAVHPTLKLADLGQPGPLQPHWAKAMANRRRKTLVVCSSCHSLAHTGQPATPLTQ
jgi:transposase